MPPFEAFNVRTTQTGGARKYGIGNRRTPEEVGSDIVAVHEKVAKRGGQIVAQYVIQDLAVIPEYVVRVSYETFREPGDVLMLIAEFPETTSQVSKS